MITLRITDNREDIRKWTGLPSDNHDEAYWLVSQMENYCCGYNEVEYNGKWYYTVHHA